ncbi:response regulator transcription factor, partial [Nocardioides sp.]|uniref:response regulator transcription factor n=1 Tax=Nocardioides sp. TaxID=35761 RepID=UPI0027369D24
AVVVSDLFEDALGHAAGHTPSHDFDLSPREAEVLALIAKGMSNKEIAQTVFLSVNSVKTYIRTAYRKIGVHRRGQAVVWAHEHGFAPLAPRIIASDQEREP